MKRDGVLTKMKYELRDYQKAASDAAVMAFNDPQQYNGILVCPTGSGKSLIIADIASRLDEPLLVFQPSKEILEQNHHKMLAYGITDIGIYSASMGVKHINRITLATIGSVNRHREDFRQFHRVLIDEAHLVNARGGMYEEFINDVSRRVVGLTATPYRLAQQCDPADLQKPPKWRKYYPILRFITRTRPRVFDRVLYVCQVGELQARGYLAEVRYFDLQAIDRSRLKTNGGDFTEESMYNEFRRASLFDQLVDVVRRLYIAGRRGILVFTRFLDEANALAENMGGLCKVVTGETHKPKRDAILRDFKSGKIAVVANVGVLTTGFDYPELDTIVLARPTTSLSLYYQMVGRCIRPSEGKQAWLVDLCGNVGTFGKVSDLVVERDAHGLWCVTSNGRQLTNVLLK